VDDARNVWDEIPDWGGVGARRLVRAGTLGGSVWEFQPGQGQFVYHFHHASEELLVVLRGAPTVRLQDGDRELKEGDVVGFPRGAEGLIVSTNADPDVAEYDSGKVGIWIEGSGRFFRVEDAVEHSGAE
jgi:quercetin dioxygenase-like cupin family protein